jgi:hypothetical protein
MTGIVCYIVNPKLHESIRPMLISCAGRTVIGKMTSPFVTKQRGNFWRAEINDEIQINEYSQHGSQDDKWRECHDTGAET